MHSRLQYNLRSRRREEHPQLVRSRPVVGPDGFRPLTLADDVGFTYFQHVHSSLRPGRHAQDRDNHSSNAHRHQEHDQGDSNPASQGLGQSAEDGEQNQAEPEA